MTASNERRALGAIASAAGGYLAWRAVRYAATLRNRGVAQGKRFVILGAGFAGREATKELARLLPGAGNGEITVVDERPYLLFTPMLTEAAGGDIKTWHITSSVEMLPAKASFREGKIESIDPVQRRVKLADGEEFSADHLVVALGSVSNFHHVPGVEDVAITMKSLADADAICRRALQRTREAGQEQDPAIRKELLTFVVAGGGYTGVETMAALNDLVRDEIGRSPRLNATEVRMLIVEPLDRIMMEVTPDLAAYAQAALESRGVEVILNAPIKGATATSVTLGDGTHIPCRNLIWTAGVTPSAVVQNADAPKGKQHGLQVTPALQVVDRPGVWALGDCAEVPQGGSKQDGTPKTYAPTAQNATREGVHVARNIVRSLRGEPLRDFRYTPIGELALVGRKRGVARIYGHNFSGVTAWALWRAIYLAKMPGVTQRARIAADWVLSAIFVRHPAAESAPELRSVTR